MPYKSRIPAMTGALLERADKIAERAAEEIVKEAQDRVALGPAPIHLRDAIHAERVEPGQWAVIAGDTEAFYGHIVEHGSVHAAPHPFLMPAAELVAPRIDSIAKEALGSL